MEAWLKCLRSAEKTCIMESGKKKVLYRFPDGREMAEEYNLETQMVSRRAWKVSRTFGGEPTWEIELGDSTAMPANLFDPSGIQETNTAPTMSKRITKSSIEWRIRNLPYPIETYDVVANSDDRCIIVRTTNKKFFKQITVPDLDRLKLPIEQDRISIAHKFNTLIISYKKPPEMSIVEKLVLEEINKLEAPKENPVQCPAS